MPLTVGGAKPGIAQGPRNSEGAGSLAKPMQSAPCSPCTPTHSETPVDLVVLDF